VAAANHPGAVKSPMVGTVYLSGEPGSAPFVAPGATVAVGDTLLIVEAMKVMNPITAPRAGTVKQVLVIDAQPVEYDQPLVIIE
jgi:acetyl-CoA carboxylase biotin carboxyl carrier protein